MSLSAPPPAETAASLPVGDPQFWIVTLATLAVLALLAWRMARTAKAGNGLPCARCPQAAAHRRARAAAPRPVIDAERRARSRS